MHALVILPGIPLEPEGTYGLVVTDRVLDLSGEPLVRSPFFELVVAPFQPGEAPEVTASRPLVEEVLGVAETLSPLPIPRDDVALAVRIAIRSTDHFPDDVLAMRQWWRGRRAWPSSWSTRIGPRLSGGRLSSLSCCRAT